MRTRLCGSDAFTRALLTSWVVLLALAGPTSAQEPDRSELLAELQDRDWRVRRAAARQLGEIASQDGTRRAYVLRIIHDVLVSAELERRISELEERQEPGTRRVLPGAAAVN